jgi:2,6-dihydroxypseudooxynicotine hydrolase
MSQTIEKSWDNYTNRFLAEGVHYGDIQKMRQLVSDWDDWCAGWLNFAKAAEQRGNLALEKNHLLTVGLEYARASVYACFGHYLFWHAPEEKRIAHNYSAQMMQKAAPYLSPALIPMKIPYAGIEMNAYLRLPVNQEGPFPCVVCLGGLDSGKEEWLVMSSLLAQRGMAAILFDGPGQGETFYQMKMHANYTDAVSAVIDYATNRSEIIPDRIGLIGRSLGGYYGPRAAALDHRIKALAVWGAFYDLSNYASIPAHTLEGFIYVTGSKNLDEALGYIHSINLDDVVSQIVCPMFILHGGKDIITPPSNATRLAQGASGLVEMSMWPESGHCNHDIAHFCRPAMADFLKDHL